MNRMPAAWKILTALVLATSGAACAEQAARLPGAALPQEAMESTATADDTPIQAPASEASTDAAPAADVHAADGTAADSADADDADGAALDAESGSDSAVGVAADGSSIHPNALRPKCPPRCPITILPKAAQPFVGRVVFVSDRSGSPKLYVADAAKPDDAPTLIGNYGMPTAIRSPVWSPNGKVIAFLSTESPLSNSGGPGTDAISFVDAGGSPLAWFSTHDLKLPNQHLDYLTWSHKGDKVCFSHYVDWAARGLSCLEFLTYKAGDPIYNFNQRQVRRIVEIGGVARDKLVIAPSESTFAAGDGTLYFSADTAATRGRLYNIAVPKTSVNVSGTPTTFASPVKDNLNAPIDLVFSPSFGVQEGIPSLLLNRECAGNPANGCLDEELYRYSFVSRELTRLTAVSGNQYGSYGRGADGAYVMQTSSSANGPADIAFVTADDVQTTVSFGDSGNVWNDFAPDWWVK